MCCYWGVKGAAEPVPAHSQQPSSSLVLVRGEAETCWGLGVPPLTLFVSCQHPHFDVAQFQQLDGLGDSILQLVLDGRGPEQLEGGDGVSWHRAGQDTEVGITPGSNQQRLLGVDTT